MLPIVLSLFFAAAPPVEVISTRCSTEVVHLFPATTPGFPGFDAQRLGTCGADESGDALWQLDRLESADGSLDGRYARRRANALVYVFDTGVEINHDEFADGNVIAGIDIPKLLGDKPGCPGATNEALHPCYAPGLVIYAAAFSHGTGVASIIGGRHVGVAPGASIVSVYAITDRVDRFLRALDEIIHNAWDPATPQVRTAIINMSSQLASEAVDPQHAIEQKIRDMVAGVDANGNPDPVNGKRFLFVVAGGNADVPAKTGGPRGQCTNAYDVSLYPATLGPSIEGLITVGGSQKDNRLWVDSCRGAAIELLAPAEAAMPATNSGHDHYRLSLSSGTSFSAPIVAGLAAQLLTLDPDLSPAELEQRLETTPSFVIDAPPGTTARHVYVNLSGPRRRTAAPR
jgi:subtilisin family serine protease